MPSSTLKGRVSLVVSLALAGVLLYYSLRGIDWGHVRALVGSAKPQAIALLIGAQMLALALRALRWRVLLGAIQRVPVLLTFFATSAGYLANNVLPARAGEVVRTLMISRRTGISRTFVLTTAFLERVADAIALVTISGIVLAFAASAPEWLSRAAVPVAAAGAIGLTLMVMLPKMQGLLLRLARHVPGPERIANRAEYLLRQVLHGVSSFHDRGRFLRFIVLTLVIWYIDAMATVIAADAVHLTIGLPLAFLLVAALGLSSALPSTPGYVGIFQFVAVGVLTPAGFTRTEAIAYILFWQAINYLVISFWGSIALFAERRQGISPLSTKATGGSAV